MSLFHQVNYGEAHALRRHIAFIVLFRLSNALESCTPSKREKSWILLRTSLSIGLDFQVLIWQLVKSEQAKAILVLGGTSQDTSRN